MSIFERCLLFSPPRELGSCGNLLRAHHWCFKRKNQIHVPIKMDNWHDFSAGGASGSCVGAALHKCRDVWGAQPPTVDRPRAAATLCLFCFHYSATRAETLNSKGWGGNSRQKRRDNAIYFAHLPYLVRSMD